MWDAAGAGGGTLAGEMGRGAWEWSQAAGVGARVNAPLLVQTRFLSALRAPAFCTAFSQRLPSAHPHPEHFHRSQPPWKKTPQSGHVHLKVYSFSNKLLYHFNLF
ncbi:hypothetical protein AAFF_G00375380 [Aldrovandia affinis]|uniref:Uncharacterized protein n=1 Tax=Aldrovandia affinis TaxID=143900 RepID=A0AAD7SG94_9TELE|nr:hypothetical protein AAFF_G00375380 [Aldrovandia affinis]